MQPLEIPQELIDAAKQYKNLELSEAEIKLWYLYTHKYNVMQIAKAVELSRQS